ncbi:MAG: hypothetical protein ACNI27_01700 [Desulfovibrio sp.]
MRNSESSFRLLTISIIACAFLILSGCGNDAEPEKLVIAPDVGDWYAVAVESGEPMVVAIGETKVLPPTNDELNSLRAKRPLAVAGKTDDGQLKVAYSDNGKVMHLGVLTVEAADKSEKAVADQPVARKEHAKTQTASPQDVSVQNFYVTKKVPVNTYIDLGRGFPFGLRTVKYSDDKSEFALINKESMQEIVRREIFQRGSEMISYDGSVYMVSVVQVNHLKPVPYAKFSVVKLNI